MVDVYFCKTHSILRDEKGMERGLNW